MANLITTGINNLKHISLTLALILTSSIVLADEALLCGKSVLSSIEPPSSGMETEQSASRSSYQSCFYSTYGLGVSLLDPEGTSNGWSSDNKPSFGASIGVGWDISTHWFSELRYTYLGSAGLENSNPVVDSSIDAEIKYHAPSLMIGRKLLSDSPDFNAFVKIGGTWIQSKENDDSITHDEDSKLQASIGAGLRFNITESPWFVDFVYDGFSKDANMVSVQFNRYFEPSQRKTKPTTTAFEQPKPDSDHDGIPNDKDRCPFSKSGEKVDQFGCCLSENGCTVSFPEH